MKTSRTLVRGGLAAGVAVAALGGAFALGANVGDDPSPTPGSSDKPVQRVAKAGDPLGSGDLALVSAGTCDDLLGWYKENTRDMVTAWGWGRGMVYAEGGGPWVNLQRGTANSFDNLDAMADAPVAASAGKALHRSQTSSETGTNVQESGVDEPDVVKTNGKILLRLDGDDLTTYSVEGKTPERLSRLDLPGTTQRDAQPDMLLVGDRAVVFSQRWSQDGPRTTVQTVDLSDPESPEVTSESRYAASLLSARQYGETVRLVLATDLPQLDFVQPQGKFTQREALKENRKVLEESTIDEWLPGVRETVDGKEGDSSQLVDCADMARPEDFTGGGSISVVGYDPESPTDRSTTGVATSSQTVYSSTDRLYLATSASFGWGGCCVMIDRVAPPGWGGGPTDDGTTQLHAFSLDGDTAAYVGSGEVEGTVRDRWSMDAVGGTLRVAAGPSSETGNSNSIVTLKEEDGELVPLGRVDKLGINEQIMSARWFDDLAILVTFRQVDPLYAIDLSDPAHPKAIGSLKIPGYSDYLHPIGKDRILGLGVDADSRGRTRGGQVAVFDLADLRHPRQLGVEKYSTNIEVRAGQDPRQFTWLPDQQTALTVISRYGRAGGMIAWVSVLEVAKDGSIDRHNVKGTDGYADVAALRTVPLPDGRVALVTEDSARFLTW
jgi:hypothetical protein